MRKGVIITAVIIILLAGAVTVSAVSSGRCAVNGYETLCHDDTDDHLDDRGGCRGGHDPHCGCR